MALRVGDVDLHTGLLAVTIAKTAEEDEMPMTMELQNELRRWLTTYASDLGQSIQPSMMLFPARTGPRFTYSEVEGRSLRSTRPASWEPSRPTGAPSQVVQEALRKAGHPTKREGVHTIRRSVARAYFDRETSLGYDGPLGARKRCFTMLTGQPRRDFWG